MCTRLNTGSSHSIEFFSAVYADIFSIFLMLIFYLSGTDICLIARNKNSMPM